MNSASTPQGAMTVSSNKRFPRRGRYFMLALNAAFFAYVAYWLSTHVNQAALLTQLKMIPPGAILVAMAMNSAVLTLYGFRLASILGAKALPCFLVATIGFTFNSLMPFRIGEGVKIYFGGAFFGLPIGGLGAAIVMEKLYDLSAIAILTALVGANADSSVIGVGRPTILALAACVVFCSLSIARLRARDVIAPPSQWALVKAARLDVIARQAESLFAHPNVARPALFTSLIWATNVSLVLILFRTLLPEIHFGLLDAMTLMVVAALAIAVPASPAGLGVFEAGIVAYLTTMHGVQTEKAISAALAYHFSITVPHTLIVVAFFGSMAPRLLRARSTS
jgi:uncharacterized membrane protein YbhN (UPF0104 family)